MNSSFPSALAAGAAALLLGSTVAFAARVNPDVPPPQKRQGAVATAERLTQRKELPPVSGVVSPFNPPEFNKPDVSDLPAPVQAGGQSAPAPVRASDRTTLENLAEQITPSGVILVRGAPRLVIGKKPFEVGTRFTATYKNEDYELELIAIDRTTFTLRYRGEEITRPIKPVR